MLIDTALSYLKVTLAIKITLASVDVTHYCVEKLLYCSEKVALASVDVTHYCVEKLLSCS
jgi:hypothetical protein